MLSGLYNKIRLLWNEEHDRTILWAPVCMGIGIAWYFHLHYEPPLWLGSVLLLICTSAAALLRKQLFFRYSFIAFALVAFGIALCQLRTHSIHTTMLAAPLEFAHVSGRVAQISPTPKGSKLILEDVTIEKLRKDQTPDSISLTLRSYDANLITGQRIALRAGLFPPPEASLPGGFDFHRYFFFQGIGAVGYGIPPMDIKSLANSGASGFDIWFAEFRHRLTESIRSYFHEPAGAVAAAFITGEVREIPESVNDDMRIAGLYHLLAVSGMNLSVVAGLAFFTLRFLLAAIPPIAVRYPIKKWAAMLALIASYIYLRVSGSPVPAERAFFMVSLVFIAILLDRDPSPMRSVAIAAFCIMLYEPEASLTASFQLSFSATAALIASYEWGTDWFARQRGMHGWGIKAVAFYFAAVIATSFVAWMGTEPFIIYHFNQFSSYSLIANTLAEPLVSFILMPLVITGVLLLPLHLSWMVFMPMQYGVDALLWIAHFVAHLPHAMWIVPSPTDHGFFVAILGGLWVYFWRARWRWLGLIAVSAGMATAFFYVPPDVLVSGDGKQVAVRLSNGQVAMVKGRSNNLTAQAWARAEIEHEMLKKEDAPLQCDSKGCIVHAGTRTIAIVHDTEAAVEDCRMNDVVIATLPIDHTLCPATALIDKTLLDKGGSAALWFKGSKIDSKQVKSEAGERPWSGR